MLSPIFESSITEAATQDHAYDDAIRDVAGAIHVASPMTLEISDPRELIGPAIGGTTNLLESALAHGYFMTACLTIALTDLKYLPGKISSAS